MNMSLDLCPVCTVFERYKSYSPYDMKESIRKEVKGDLEKSFLTLGNQHHPNTTRVLFHSDLSSAPHCSSPTLQQPSCLHSGVLRKQAAVLCQQTQ